MKIIDITLMTTLLLPLFALIISISLGSIGKTLGERSIARLVSTCLFGSFLSISILAVYFLLGTFSVHETMLGSWFSVADYHFEISFLADGLSVSFAWLCALMCFIISQFAKRYMHRDPGVERFFTLLIAFSFGMQLVVLAGTADLIFAGWEVVSICSVLLIGYFNHRTAPVKSALAAFGIYRICDLGLMLGAVFLHHETHTARFYHIVANAPWPNGTFSTSMATVIGFVMMLAAFGKSAQFPFSSWLPRAMEGPTPSSALFYGALSIHAGAYLLLRMSPVYDASPIASYVLVAVGAITAILGSLSAHVRTDAKTALAYASMTQSGVIVMEIGLGFRWLVVLHIFGHAALRTFQLLRAPNTLHEMHELENEGGGVKQHEWYFVHLLPQKMQLLLYRAAIQGGYVDSMVRRIFVDPLFRFGTWASELETKWTRRF